jgi:DNA-directed RNA polymerase specialized sigma24 family protein
VTSTVRCAIAPTSTALPLEGIELSRDGHDDELIELDGLIEALEEQDGRLAEVVRLRFWAGLSTKETARALECSDRTVKRDWAYARAFLIDSLGLGGEGEDQPDDL